MLAISDQDTREGFKQPHPANAVKGAPPGTYVGGSSDERKELLLRLHDKISRLNYGSFSVPSTETAGRTAFRQKESR